MDSPTQLRYQGCITTPALWRNNSVLPYPQIDLSEVYERLSNADVFESKRLGKLVEEFIFHQLKKQNSISWITDSLQIQDGKRTIGEIDALFYLNDRPVHLEVAYKFYLFDTVETYDDQLGYWIGPNRNDRLSNKLTKLHDRQFPLLYNDLTKIHLEQYELESEQIDQKLCFKAQLFLPYGHTSLNVSPLNQNCVTGYYLAYRELSVLEPFEFHLPLKVDWLITPHFAVSWGSYATMRESIALHLDNGKSPLIWIKDATKGELTKCFVVPW